MSHKQNMNLYYYICIVQRSVPLSGFHEIKGAVISVQRCKLLKISVKNVTAVSYTQTKYFIQNTTDLTVTITLSLLHI